MTATGRETRPAMRHCGGALPEMVDIAFALAGENLPPDFEWPLYREIARLVPWILKTPRAGILPVRGPRTPEGGVMITHRTRLVVRLPRDRVCSSSALERKSLAVGGRTSPWARERSASTCPPRPSTRPA